MSYISKAKIAPTSKKCNSLIDVLRGTPNVELVKYHPKYVKPCVIPVKYNGLYFEFVMDHHGSWELWYQSLFHKKVHSTEKIANYFDELIDAWSQFECNHLTSSEES